MIHESRIIHMHENEIQIFELELMHDVADAAQISWCVSVPMGLVCLKYDYHYYAFIFHQHNYDDEILAQNMTECTRICDLNTLTRSTDSADNHLESLRLTI